MTGLTDPGALIFLWTPVALVLYTAGWALLLSVIGTWWHQHKRGKGE